MSEERLQKVLARAGIAARRKAEELITAGRVRVDGEVVTTLGTKVDPRKQRVELDGRPVMPEKLCYGVLHKPRGMVTTLHDPEGRPTALDILRQVGVRVVPVGRLDFNTSGALLFTNDGDFAQGLSHARGNVPKVYAAKIQRRLEVDDLGAWAEQIEIDGKVTRPADVRILRRDGDKTWLEVTLKEGKNRQIRRLGDHAGTPVVRLSRLSHAGIDTTGLRPGEWRLLTTEELKSLRELYGVPQKIRGAVTQGASASAGKSSPRPAALPRAPRRGGGAKERPPSREARARGFTASHEEGESAFGRDAGGRGRLRGAPRGGAGAGGARPRPSDIASGQRAHGPRGEGASPQRAAQTPAPRLVGAGPQASRVGAARGNGLPGRGPGDERARSSPARGPSARGGEPGPAARGSHAKQTVDSKKSSTSARGGGVSQSGRGSGSSRQSKK